MKLIPVPRCLGATLETVAVSGKSYPTHFPPTRHILKWVTACLPAEFPRDSGLCRVRAQPAVCVCWRGWSSCRLWYQTHCHRYGSAARRHPFRLVWAHSRKTRREESHRKVRCWHFKRADIWLFRSSSPVWMMWPRTESSQNCRKSWTMPLIPPIIHSRAHSVVNSYSPAAQKNTIILLVILNCSN